MQITLQIPQPITFSIKQLIIINARNRRVWVNIVFPSHYFRFDSLLGSLIFPFSLSFLSILITFLLSTLLCFIPLYHPVRAIKRPIRGLIKLLSLVTICNVINCFQNDEPSSAYKLHAVEQCHSRLS